MSALRWTRQGPIYLQRMQWSRCTNGKNEFRNRNSKRWNCWWNNCSTGRGWQDGKYITCICFFLCPIWILKYISLKIGRFGKSRRCCCLAQCEETPHVWIRSRRRRSQDDHEYHIMRSFAWIYKDFHASGWKNYQDRSWTRSSDQTRNAKGCCKRRHAVQRIPIPKG